MEFTQKMLISTRGKCYGREKEKQVFDKGKVD